jgi:hypothetical protein
LLHKKFFTKYSSQSYILCYMDGLHDFFFENILKWKNISISSHHNNNFAIVFESKLLQLLLKHTQIMNLHEHGKKKIKKLKKNWLWKVEGKSCRVLPSHWFFTSASTTTNASFVTNESNMVSKYWLLHMLRTQLKGQMLNATIHIRYPLYIDVIMFKLW